MRKTIFTLGLMLAAALSLTNCTKNEEANFTPEVKPSFELFANLESRTTNDGMSTKWANGDKINVFHAEVNTANYKNDGSFSTEDATGLFKGTLAGELTAATYDWYAIYPYVELVTTPANTTSGYVYIGGRSDTPQLQDGNNSTAHIAGKNYPLVGVAKGVAASEKPAITMSHISSLVEFNVTNKLTEDITVTSIALKALEDIVGTYYIDFTGETIDYTPGDYVSQTATLNVSNGTAIKPGESAKFYMAIKPTEFDGDNILITINASTANGKGVMEIEKEVETAFYAGKMKTLKIGFNAEIEEAAPEVWSLVTSPTQITDGTYVFVAKQKNGTTISYLPNATASAKNVLQVNTTLFDLTTSVLESIVVPEDARWILTTTDGKYSITNPDGKYLYATNTNNGMAVGGTKDTWSITTHSKNTSAFSLKDSTNSRYLTLYSTTNWRCYTSEYPYSSSTDQNGEIYIYYCGQLAATPTITANDISDVSADGVTNASASFTAQNLTEDITVTCDGDVVTAATVTDSTITYSVSKNETDAAREGWIKLAANGITVEIKVAQLAPTVSITIAEFLEKSESTTAWYQLTGMIISIDNSTYGNLTIKDDTGEVYVYGLTKTKVSKNDQSFSSLELKAGDTVTLIGTRASHNGTAQVGGPAYYVSHVVGDPLEVEITPVTIAEFLEKPVSTSALYQLTGEITNIANTTYGNLTIEDETGEVYVYGLKKDATAGNQTFSELGLKVGDIVTLVGNRGVYNDSPQVTNAYYVSHTSSTTPEPEPEPTDGVYTLLTNISDLKVGDKIVIAAKGYDYAMSVTQNNNNRGQAAIEKSGSTITFDSDVQIITVEAGTKTDTFAFNTGSGYLYAASSSSNYLRTKTDLDNNGSWAITIATDGTADVKAQGTYTRSVMQYNPSSKIFACYGYASQQAIAIYRLAE